MTLLQHRYVDLRADRAPMIEADDHKPADLAVHLPIQPGNAVMRAIASPTRRTCPGRLRPEHHEDSTNFPKLLQMFCLDDSITYGNLSMASSTGVLCLTTIKLLILPTVWRPANQFAKCARRRVVHDFFVTVGYLLVSRAQSLIMHDLHRLDVVLPESKDRFAMPSVMLPEG